jgi:hypothetical protein
MHIGSRNLALAAIALACFLGWQKLSPGAQEVVVLRTQTFDGQDHYATLWVAQAENYLWIRAETPTRRWLPAVRAHPEVILRRHGRDRRYTAQIFDDPEARAYVDSLFRAKYGLADWVRGVFTRRDSIPIRLALRQG